MVDQHTLEVFADEPEVMNWKDQVAAIHELFANLPADPQEAQVLIEQHEQPTLRQLTLTCLYDAAQEAKATPTCHRKGVSTSNTPERLSEKTSAASVPSAISSGTFCLMKNL